jgi:hypothetical protein
MLDNRNTIYLYGYKRKGGSIMKNLETLVKAINKAGFGVSLSQITTSYTPGRYVWSCFIHDYKQKDNTVVSYTHGCHKDTAYAAIKNAIEHCSIQALKVIL